MTADQAADASVLHTPWTVTDEAAEQASRKAFPTLWAKIDANIADDDWNGGTALNLRHSMIRDAKALLGAALIERANAAGLRELKRPAPENFENLCRELGLTTGAARAIWSWLCDQNFGSRDSFRRGVACQYCEAGADFSKTSPRYHVTEYYEGHERSHVLCRKPAEQPRVALVEAARNLINARFSTYKARNGREVGIEDESGEKCWIVPFDEMAYLEREIESASATPAREK